jgi:phosphoribosylaminoimidazole-succinocarboxamide synthase/phosphoribosylcarboxyaminoimidazole (NCAIR) mutase
MGSNRTDLPAIEGKTKQIFKIPHSTRARVVSKRDITAGDGAKRDEFEHKDVYATTVTCRVFELLRNCNIPVAYVRQTAPTEFEVEWTEMIPLEIVARRIIGEKSSYRKRNPHVSAGTRFETLVVEFFLKTTDKKFGSHTLVKDDPLIIEFGSKGTGITICRPDLPVSSEGVENPHIKISAAEMYGSAESDIFPYHDLEKLVRKVFLALEGAWLLQGLHLCDLKIECGLTSDNVLVVSDVIDADSWRLIDKDGRGLDKQGYRDGAAMDAVADVYAEVARRVQRFEELHDKPQIILWCASRQDSPVPFQEEVDRLNYPARLSIHYGSIHKQPEASLAEFRKALLVHPMNTVVIVYVGRSNGAGPVFACDTHVPVIAVSATTLKCPEDIWSSINVPSDCPLLFQKYPANAIQAAIGIISAKSPVCYMSRRMIVEDAHRNASNSPTYQKEWI